MPKKDQQNKRMNGNSLKKSKNVNNVYSINGVYPNDIRETLLNNTNELNDKHRVENNNCPKIICEVNGVKTDILVDTGAELSVINKRFVNSHKNQFIDAPKFPINRTVIKTADKSQQSVSEQMLVNLFGDEWVWEVPVIIVDELICDMIIGVDQLRKVKAKINLIENEMECMIKNKVYKIKFNLSKIDPSNKENNNKRNMIIKRPDIEIKAPEAAYGTDINQCLSKSQKLTLNRILDKHKNVFSEVPSVTNVYEHRIVVDDESKFVRKTYPIPLHYQQRVDLEVNKMLENGIIERSNSNFINPMVVVKKKNDEIRLCLDMRNLNSVTQKSFDCAPTAESLFLKCQGVKYMTRLDLTSSFWQIGLHKDSRKYTAFIYKNKCYQFRVVPFGLVTSLAAIIRCLELALGPEVDSFVSIFVDDILIMSKSFEEHVQHLDIIFKKLEQANLVLKKEKCEFMKSQIKFLGHIISEEGVRTDPEKIRSITQFPVPSKAKDVRAFLGLTGYYKRFSPKYSDTITPLLELLRKGNKKWKWDVQHQSAFDEVKNLFSSSLHLFHPDKEGKYMLYTDASDIAVGGVLYQRDDKGEHKVIAYANRTLKGAEKNYFTSEKEVLAIVYALSKFRYYLFGQPFEIHTDNQALSFILKCKLTNARLTRWIMAIQEYDFVIKYCRAIDNKVADTLSRHVLVEDHEERTHETQIIAIKYEMSKELENRLKNIHLEQDQDPGVINIKEKVRQQEHHRYKIEENTLYKLMDDRWKIVLPQSLLEDITWACHESLAHAGAYRCYLVLREDFICNSMVKKIRTILRSCYECQTSKYPNQHTYVEMKNIVTKGKGEIVCVDFLGPLPRASRGLRNLVVFTDAFTKIVKLYPVTNQNTKSVLNALLNKYVREHGQVKRILSDQGKQFQNKLWSSSLEEHGIEPVLTSIRRPQGNLAERVNRELGRLFRIYCSERQSSWPQYIPFFEKTLNENYHTTTGFTPIELDGQEPPTRFWAKCIKRLNTANMPIPIQMKCQLADARIKRAAEKRTEQFNKSHRLQAFKVGERVLLKAHRLGKSEENTATKFFRLYNGPYTLREQVGRNTFLVADERKNKVLGKYHASALRKFYPKPEP